MIDLLDTVASLLLSPNMSRLL